MGENGECGPCAKARLDRVMEDIRARREGRAPKPSGQTGLGDFV
ncbi:hypothetical protein HRTV-25_gp43 [Halorubrum tailed virus 25]|uniref:Uncharacterized protein n=1 Tax=Halorubrum tailed virus 25 TaxID=2878006 RepID=A0AAE8XZT6_9CAUD|nr:hypothetical protein M1M37_gp043 [Halorubrum tailed virus 25]UBF22624.1 hypothetical protein HRTV-25_gp43 [Halorubrum tailed virus 25]